MHTVVFWCLVLQAAVAAVARRLLLTGGSTVSAIVLLFACLIFGFTLGVFTQGQP